MAEESARGHTQTPTQTQTEVNLNSESDPKAQNANSPPQPPPQAPVPSQATTSSVPSQSAGLLSSPMPTTQNPGKYVPNWKIVNLFSWVLSDVFLV